ncbi:MAG: sugar phosphate nucleotidyltransferase [Actinomycetota bacterium]
MKALLIAGGFGTRLRPLTYTRPKHLLPIANREHIHHVFDLLQRHGINDAVLLTSYLAEAFDEAVAVASARGMRVEVTHEPEPLGTAGAMKNAEHLVTGDTFFAFNGDILSDMDLTAMLDFHRSREAEGTIVLTPVEDPSAFGVVPTEEDGRVLGFIEKPPPGEAPTNLINAGVYILEPSVLTRIPAGAEWSAERALFPGLVEEGARLFAVPTDGYWMDVGTPEKYLATNLDALSGRFKTDAVPDPAPAAVVAGEGAEISAGARVSSACLGPRVVVEAGAVVERSVVLPGTVIASDAHVKDSILGAGVSVAAGAHLDGVTVADGDSVGS